MTVEEAKQHQKKVMDARAALNEAIFAAKKDGVYSELEIREVATQRIGDCINHYPKIEVRCFIDPTKLD